MKTNLLLFAAAISFVALTSSCNKDKCSECHYDKSGLEVEMGEFCGDALEDLETLGSFTDTSGTYVVHCEGHWLQQSFIVDWLIWCDYILTSL